MKAEVFPATAAVGEHGSFRLKVSMEDGALAEGGWIRVRPRRSVSNYWAPAQCSRPREENYVTARLPDGVEAALDLDAGWDATMTIRQGTLTATDAVELVYGDTGEGGPGFRVSTLAGRAELRVEYGEAAGAPPRAIPSAFLTILPGKPVGMNVRLRREPERDDLLLRLTAVDRYGNTATDIGEPVDLEPVAGFETAEVPAFPALGKAVCETELRTSNGVPGGRIRVTALSLDLTALSDPVSADRRVFWGDLHCHTRIAQALETPEFLYEYARDDAALDFLCHVEHYSATAERWWYEGMESGATGSRVTDYIEASWARQKELIETYARPGRFVPFLGFEWASNIYGHMNVIYRDTAEDVIYPSGFREAADTPAGLYERLHGREALVIPHHPSWPVNNESSVSGVDWSFYDERLTRLVEICSKHGVSEYLGCPDAIGNQAGPGTVRSALKRGYRLGFVGSTDSHASRPGSYGLSGDLWARWGGVTAVFADTLDRESIFQALKNRRCYATTGARMFLDFSVNGHPMGADVRMQPDEERIFSMEVMGTSPLEGLELVRNGEVVYRERPDSGDTNLAATFTDRPSDSAEDCYYMRIMQADGHQAWSSPVWITRLDREFPGQGGN